jgi:hypothetical protein
MRIIDCDAHAEERVATDLPRGAAFRQNRLAQGLEKRGDLSDTVIEKLSVKQSPTALLHSGRIRKAFLVTKAAPNWHDERYFH